jgi:hypothetical protein
MVKLLCVDELSSEYERLHADVISDPQTGEIHAGSNLGLERGGGVPGGGVKAGFEDLVHESGHEAPGRVMNGQGNPLGAVEAES